MAKFEWKNPLKVGLGMLITSLITGFVIGIVATALGAAAVVSAIMAGNISGVAFASTVGIIAIIVIVASLFANGMLLPMVLKFLKAKV